MRQQVSSEERFRRGNAIPILIDAGHRCRINTTRRNREKDFDLSSPFIALSGIRWDRSSPCGETAWSAISGDVQASRAELRFGNAGFAPSEALLAAMSRHARVMGT